MQDLGAAFDPVLLAALRSLPPRMRAVLVLRFLEDRSEAQTAAELGCSIGMVKSTSSRGVSRLRMLLEREAVARPLGAVLVVDPHAFLEPRERTAVAARRGWGLRPGRDVRGNVLSTAIHAPALVNSTRCAALEQPHHPDAEALAAVEEGVAEWVLPSVWWKDEGGRRRAPPIDRPDRSCASAPAR